jgi:rRNA-processing protein FCF1
MASDRIRGDPSKQIVLLDTSAIMMMFEFHINIDDELTRILGSYSLFVPERVLKELDVLHSKGKGKQKRLAKASLQLAKIYDVYPGFSELEGDDAVIAAAVECSAIVVTNDCELRRRLREKSIRSIFLRGKDHLMLD